MRPEPLYKRALAIREKAFSADHPVTATSLNGLAYLYELQGRYAEAAPLYKRAGHPRESIRRRPPGYRHQPQRSGIPLRFTGNAPRPRRSTNAPWPFARNRSADHPDTATSLNGLAALYYSQGKYAEAEPLYKRALAIREKAFGASHRDTAISLNGLALLYELQGRYAEAEPLYKRALAIPRKPSAPTIRIPLSASTVWRDSTNYRASTPRPSCSTRPGIKVKALGAEHPSTAVSLNDLAALYESQDKYAEAEPLTNAPWPSSRNRSAPIIPIPPEASAIWRDSTSQGKYAEAEPLYKRALAVCEKALGADHPDTAVKLNNLAYLYKSQGRRAEAEPLFKRALAPARNRSALRILTWPLFWRTTPNCCEK